MQPPCRIIPSGSRRTPVKSHGRCRSRQPEPNRASRTLQDRSYLKGSASCRQDKHDQNNANVPRRPPRSLGRRLCNAECVHEQIHQEHQKAHEGTLVPPRANTLMETPGRASTCPLTPSKVGQADRNASPRTTGQAHLHRCRGTSIYWQYSCCVRSGLVGRIASAYT